MVRKNRYGFLAFIFFLQLQETAFPKFSKERVISDIRTLKTKDAVLPEPCYKEGSRDMI